MKSVQRGAVLIVSLLLLVAMTLIAIAAINSSTVNLLIVGNMQSQKEVEADVQEAIEIVLGSAGSFVDPPNAGEQTSVTLASGKIVTVEQIDCRGISPAPGYSAQVELVPNVVNWWVTAGDTNDEGARAKIHQGVYIRMPANNPCP